MPHQSPNKSNAHQVLCRKAIEAGIAEKDLRDLLWLINADDELTCFVPVCANLSVIFRLMDEYFPAYCTAQEIPSKRWMNITNWITANFDDLTLAIGEHFNYGPIKLNDEQLQDEVLKPSLANPLVGHCATRNPLYTVLLNSLASESVAECERYFLMVGQFIVAHIHACRKYVPREKYENHGGSRQIRGIPNSPYTAALALRVLSGEEDLSFLPRKLDPKRSPEEFAQVAKREKSSADELLKHLFGYCRFIARAHSLLRWSNRAGGGGGRGRGGARWIPGYVKLGPDCEVLPAEVGDPEDVSSDWGRQVVIQEVLENGMPITKNRARQLYAADIHPYDLASEDELCLTEYACDEAAKGTAGLVYAAKGQARHVALENQLFPWQYRLLTVSELAGLLKFCSNHFRKLLRIRDWNDDQALLAETISLLHVSLWSGSTLERAKSLQVLPSDKERAKRIHCELALYASARGSKASLVEWRIRSYFPNYRVHLEAPADATRRRTAYMYVPDLAGGAQFVRHLVKRKEYQGKQALFSHGISEYRRALRTLLKEVDPSGRITEQKVTSYLFHRLVCVSGDITQAVAITGREHALAQTRIYYTTHSLNVLRKAYVKALWDIVPPVYKAAGRKPRMDYAAAIDPAVVHVGSRLCPTRDAAKKAITKLQKAIKKAANYRSWDELVTYHNYFTLYTVLMVGYATSCRAIISPFLASSEIDTDTGLAALADKDGPDHHKSRLVWIPEEVRRQIRSYEAHRDTILKPLLGHFAKADVVVPDCFFLRITDKKQFAVIAVKPSTLAEQMKGFIRLPANVHRRFLRTELIEDGCPTEVVDAFMGHWSRGEEPHGLFSSFSYREHVTALEQHLVPLLKDLGWQLVESALI